MAEAQTTNLQLTTVQANDRLPESVSKTNFERLDSYVGATRLTNKSGAQVTAGDVVIADITTDSSFTTTTTAGHQKVAGVAQETIANNSAGVVKHHGTSQVKVTAATARGDWLTTSATLGQALPSSAADAPAGTFAIALTSTAGAGTVTALLLVTATGGPAFTKGSDIASGAALSVGSTGLYFDVTGTTTITSISSRTAGEVVVLQFDDHLVITHNASSLILPGAQDFLTTPGNVLMFISEGSGNWRCIAMPPDPFTEAVAYSASNSSTGNWRGLFGVHNMASSGLDSASGVIRIMAVGQGMRSFRTGAASSAGLAVGTDDASKGMTSFTTGATGNDNIGIVGEGDRINASADDFDMSIVIRLNDSTSRTIFFGLKASAGSAADENEICGFRITDNGNIIGVVDSGGTETARDSALAGSAAPGTVYALRISGRAGTIKFFVNNAQIGANVTTNVPTGLVYPSWSILTSAAAQKAVDWRDMWGRIRPL